MHLKYISAVSLTLALTGGLIGCGGGGSSSGDPAGPTVKTGYFLDSAVEGVSFSTATQSGTTDPSGAFSYVNGETVIFSIGALDFPEVTAAPNITPITMVPGATDITNQEATNIARLLQSLDDNGIPGDGIVIPAGAAAAAAPVDFAVDTTTFESDNAVINLVASSGSTTTTLVTESATQNHVNTTLSELAAVVGMWKLSNLPEDEIRLALFDDGSFVYGEIGGTLVPNGMESGTYIYNPSINEFTFDVTVDMNGDAGIADSTQGSNVTLPIAVSSGSITFTSPEGDFAFTAISSSSPTAVGVWRTTDKLSTLALLSDGSFVFWENDTAPNGLEAGTYVDNGNGTVTLTLTYDDNDPGNDSGVGDIGTPVTADYALSNTNNTLTLLGGAVVLTREW